MNTNLPFHDLISTHVPTSLLCYYFTALVCIHDRHDNLHAIINVFDSVNLTLIVSVSTLIWCLTSRWTTEQEIFNIQDHWPRGTHDVTERHYGPERLRDAGETYVDGLAWKWRFCLGNYSYYYYLSSWALYNNDMLRQSSGLPSLIVVSYWTRHVVGLNRRTRGYI